MPIIILFVALALVSCSTTPAPQAEAPVSVASVKCKVGSELKPGDKCTGKTQDGEDYVFVNKDGELRWGGSYIKKRIGGGGIIYTSGTFNGVPMGLFSHGDIFLKKKDAETWVIKQLPQ